MKKLFIGVLLAVSLSLVVGCTTYYTVTTKDGTVYTSVGEPDYDRRSETYEFDDLDGKEWRINREEIVSIEERLN